MRTSGQKQTSEVAGEHTVEAGAQGPATVGKAQGESAGDGGGASSGIVVTFSVNAKRIQGISASALNKQMSREEAEAFMVLYHDQIETVLGSAIRSFVMMRLK